MSPCSWCSVVAVVIPELVHLSMLEVWMLNLKILSLSYPQEKKKEMHQTTEYANQQVSFCWELLNQHCVLICLLEHGNRATDFEGHFV